MAVMGKTQFVLDHKYDRRSSRHSLNGTTHVFHCHHYTSLYTQLAEDAAFIDARQLLADCTEDTFHEFLGDYYRQHHVTDPWLRLELAAQYYAAAGMGKMHFLSAGPDSGEVELSHSHVDEGWLKKWGKHPRPVNHFTRGYIAACFATAFDKPARSMQVTEVSGIVTGAERSRFVVVVK
jgi:hypothetical protein